MILYDLLFVSLERLNGNLLDSVSCKNVRPPSRHVGLCQNFSEIKKAFVRQIQHSSLPSQMTHVKPEDCMELMGCSPRTKGGYTTFLGLLKRQQGSKDM